MLIIMLIAFGIIISFACSLLISYVSNKIRYKQALKEIELRKAKSEQIKRQKASRPAKIENPENPVITKWKDPFLKSPKRKKKN